MIVNQIILAYPENGREIRTIFENEEIYFCLYDVTKTLAEQNVKLAEGGKVDSLSGLILAQINSLDEDEIKSFDNLPYVTQPGLFRIILRDNSRACKQFQRWVLHEVLPSIQKYGTYPAPLDGAESDVKRIVKSLLLEIEQRERLERETKEKLASHEKRMDVIDQKIEKLSLSSSETEYISVEDYCNRELIDDVHHSLIFGWSDQLKIKNFRDSKKKVVNGKNVVLFPEDIVIQATIIALSQSEK